MEGEAVTADKPPTGSKPGTTRSSRTNIAAAGSRNGSKQSLVQSKQSSKRGSQTAVPTTAPTDGEKKEETADGGAAAAVAPEQGAPATDATPSSTTEQTEEQKDQAVEDKLHASLEKMSSLLSLSASDHGGHENQHPETNTSHQEQQEDAEVGDEVQVIPQVARTLTSPLLNAADIAAEGGFTFVNADYGDFDLDGITALEDVVSLVPISLKKYMRTGSYEVLLAENTVVDPAVPKKVLIRTPMMRPSSPTMDEEDERKQKEAEAAGTVISGDVAATTENTTGIETSDAIALVEEGIDREALIASIKNELDLKEKYKLKNSFLQNKLGEYFKRKRTDETHDGEKSVADQEQRYANCMTALTSLRTEYESLNSSNQKIVNEYKVKLEEHTAEAFEKSEEFIKFKRSIALSAENSRTGKPIPPKQFAQLEATDQRKEMEVVAVRLDHIKLRNKLKRHEQLLRQKEELADGLHLIDFEQLKIENQTYNEKIEERNEELLKLRKKITNIVQVLTHVKEKLQFVQAENGSLRKELKGLDTDVAIRRDSLPASKQSRDAIKNLNTSLKQKNGLLGNKPLLRDYEDKVDETDGLKARIDDLRSTHANLSAETLAIKRQIQRKLIV
ncbi:UNVERIFIED_CONTAM: Coiled-coil domain-containing protein 96 [Siphonaria sp. JEL0065]|nr:Coiled-coil domain-containing protein 96 [Siphonaria sp. JEL0065]